MGHISPSDAVEVTVVAPSLVGRTGADGAWVLEGSSPRQDAPVAHSRPFWQQPPPKLAGQENQPVEQVYAEVGLDDDGAGVNTGVEEVVNAAELEPAVGTTAAVVDDDGGCADVDGWT